MSKILVGRDATVYTLEGGGFDTISNGFTGQGVNNLLGNWRDISVKVSKDWSEVTPSSAEWKEKRRTVQDWKATLNHYERAEGSPALDLSLAGDYLMVVFTECSSGRQIVLVGGIAEGGLDKKKEESTDTIELENVGLYNGGPSIAYND